MKSGMPMVHGVDVLAFLLEHHAEIFVLGLLLELLEIGSRARFVHVAERHDVLGLRGVVEDPRRPARRSRSRPR